VAAVDFEIVGAEGDRHAVDFSTAEGQICYIRLLHVVCIS
jgi:hypothetical protein